MVRKVVFTLFSIVQHPIISLMQSQYRQPYPGSRPAQSGFCQL